MKNRVVRIASVTPVHPPMRASAGTIGMQARNEGGRSRVQIAIDLGLKTQELAFITMSTKDAARLADSILHATIQALNANDREMHG